MDSTVKVAIRARKTTNSDNEGINIFPTEKQVVVRDNSNVFTFDHVFAQDICQEEIFNEIAEPILGKFLSGFNACILAYGQTGSGKTYTMGTDRLENDNNSEKGIIPRLLEKIFQRINEDSDNLKISLSFLEVYNDDVYDLLNKKSDRRPISVRENNHGIKMAELSEVEVNSFDEAISYLHTGVDERKTASTTINTTSSRSHAIFSIKLTRTREDKTLKSKFQLVDLAGSEPVHNVTNNTIKKEGIHINKSLLSLGNVIECLNRDKNKLNKQSFIPYRSSTLTRLLQESLGGDSFTAMIACICPLSEFNQETFSTLRYAHRVRGIYKKPISTPSWKSSSAKKLHNLYTPYSGHVSDKTRRLDKSNSICSNVTQRTSFSPIPENHLENSKMSDFVSADIFSPFLNKMTQNFEKRILSTPMIDKLVTKLENRRILKAKENIPKMLLETSREEIITSAPDFDVTTTTNTIFTKPEGPSIKRNKKENIPNPDNRITNSIFAVPEIPPLRRSLRRSTRLENKNEKVNLSAISVNCTLQSGKRRFRRKTGHEITRGFDRSQCKENAELSYDLFGSPEILSSTRLAVCKNTCEILQSPRRGWKIKLNEDIMGRINSQVLKILNKGSQNELQTLPSIGPKMAKIIYDWREVYGPLKIVSDLEKIKGLPKNFYKRFARANLVSHVDV